MHSIYKQWEISTKRVYLIISSQDKLIFNVKMVFRKLNFWGLNFFYYNFLNSVRCATSHPEQRVIPNNSSTSSKWSKTDTYICKTNWKIKLTILTEAWRNALFSSWRLFTLNLYVSSSALSTRFCCCKHSILFCHCSRVIGEGGMEGGCIIGPSVTEDESLSLALSAMFTLRNYRRRNLSCDVRVRTFFIFVFFVSVCHLFRVGLLYYFECSLVYYISDSGFQVVGNLVFDIRI